jgi:hypothetical protein
VYIHGGFDCDDVHLELENLAKDFGLVVGLISMPNEPFSFKNIVTFSDLNEDAQIA